MMKLPAIKGIIGDWIYYQTILTFQQVADLIDNDHSIREYPSLNDVLQRDLSKRSKKIKDYLIREDTRFFNSAIIGLYGENPTWYQFDFSPSAVPEMELSQELLDSVGVLEFSGGEILFSIDGQHRIDGIKQALLDNPGKFVNDELPVILLAHDDSTQGKIRTRRLFSEINTKAVRVSGLDDLITNEDDPHSINARKLYSEFSYFRNDVYIALNQRANIDPASPKFTTIINLKEVNKILYKGQYTNQDYRPSDSVLNELYEITSNFWTEAISNISMYLDVFENGRSVNEFRTIEGGNMLFRPIGINILANCYKIWNETEESGSFWDAFNAIDPMLNGNHWKDIIWDNAKTNMKKTNNKFFREYSKYLLGLPFEFDYVRAEYNKSKGVENISDFVDLPDSPN